MYFLVIHGIFVGVFSPLSFTQLTLEVPIPLALPAWAPFTACLQQQRRLRLSVVSRYMLLLRGAAFNLIVCDLISSPPDWIKLNCTAWLQHAADKCNTDGSNNLSQKYSGDPFFGGAWSLKSWKRKTFFSFSQVLSKQPCVLVLSSLGVVTPNELDGYIPYCLRLIFLSSKACFRQQSDANYVAWPFWRSPVCLKFIAVQMLMRSNFWSVWCFPPTHFRHTECISTAWHMPPTLDGPAWDARIIPLPVNVNVFVSNGIANIDNEANSNRTNCSVRCY